VNASPPLTDDLGRTVSYLRLSITDHCNLRCLYCRPREQVPYIPHDDILRYEELLTMVDLARELGIGKIRLTGGEPFLRRNFLYLVESILKRHPAVDLRLTTNGTLLPGKAKELRDLGVTAVNVSLDSLDPATFARITGSDVFAAVRRGLDEVMEAGMRLKINAVALRGVNDQELSGFLEFIRRNPVDFRFIEFMPMGDQSLWSPEYYWSAKDILAQAGELAGLAPEARVPGDSGPARMYRVDGSLGRFGVISALSDHFCHTCNRLRITPDGHLRTCLFSDKQYRLRPMLRHPKLGPEAVGRVMRLALRKKPLGYQLLGRHDGSGQAIHGMMSAIGG